MTDNSDTTDPIALHDRQVRAVTEAVAKLMLKLGPQGFTAEAIFEGAVRGGAVALLSATPATEQDVAELLAEMSAGFEELAKPNLHVVQ